MVEAEEVKEIMSEGKLAIGLEKGWVMRDSLVQQIDRLLQIRSRATGKTRRQQKIFGAVVEIEGGEVGGWWLFNGQFLSS
jgi:hypothetical protein